MKYYHEKDKSLWFSMSSPAFNTIRSEEVIFIDLEDITSLIEELNKWKEEGFDIKYYKDDGIYLSKPRNPEEIKKEEKLRQIYLDEWQKEYDAKMQILETAYRKKLELTAIMNSL
jgi:hypothetical protein